LTFLDDDGHSLKYCQLVVKGEYFIVQGPTIARFPTDPTNNAIHRTIGELIGDVKYNIAAEAACMAK